jgi:predicted DNA-binding protein YlxM (UPF0122 family)
MASSKLKEAIELLYNNPMSIEEITNTLDISRQTFYNWLKTGKFVETKGGRNKLFITESLDTADLETVNLKGKYSVKNLPPGIVTIGTPPTEQVAKAYTATLTGEYNEFNFSKELREVDSPAKAAKLRAHVATAMHLAIYVEKLMKEGTLSE